MELFRKSRKNTNTAVWRNAAGKIDCPGDGCMGECDDTCPIYLHTEAMMITQFGQCAKAIPFLEKALQIAPDFYDAWNNLGGIYGQLSEYQKAYDCYKKARELNTVKPNPVFGLMITSRDLGKYEECIYWCDVYKTLSDDGRDIAIRNVAARKLNQA